MSPLTLVPPPSGEVYSIATELITRERDHAYADAARWALIALEPGSDEHRFVTVALAYGAMLACDPIDPGDGLDVMAALMDAYDIGEAERSGWVCDE